MDRAAPCPMNMTDMEYYRYSVGCDELRAKLDKCISYLMAYIFQGRCQDIGQWETLFGCLSRAVVMKEYLELYLLNIGTIAENFLAQFEQWHAELEASLN